jgi:AcrR family transcriptional regulator
VGPPLRRDAAANRERLVAAAERVFAERGTGAGLDDIAREAGVGPATLYRRFANKDALVREVLHGFFARLIDLAHQAADDPAPTCLQTYFDTVGWELAARRGLMHSMWGDLAPASLVEELRDLTKRVLEKAQDGGGISRDVTVEDIAATVAAVRGILQGGRDTAPTTWRRHVAYVLAGFRTASSRTRHGTADVPPSDRRQGEIRHAEGQPGGVRFGHGGMP